MCCGIAHERKSRMKIKNKNSSKSKSAIKSGIHSTA
jgi:hypothetical protein